MPSTHELTKTATAIVIFLAGASAVCAEASAQRDLTKEEANRRIVVNFYNRFFNQHEINEAAKVVAQEYKQHNPYVADGKAPFITYFTAAFEKNPNSRARIIRSATDGDLVYLHVHSTQNPNELGKSGVDIFRVRDGVIVEHWDVIQSVPEKAANENGMF